MSEQTDKELDDRVKIAKKYNWSSDKDFQVAVMMLKEVSSNRTAPQPVGDVELDVLDELFDEHVYIWVEDDSREKFRAALLQREARLRIEELKSLEHSGFVNIDGIRFDVVPVATVNAHIHALKAEQEKS